LIKRIQRAVYVAQVHTGWKHARTVVCAAFSPDGSVVVSGSYDGNLKVGIVWCGVTQVSPIRSATVMHLPCLHPMPAFVETKLMLQLSQETKLKGFTSTYILSQGWFASQGCPILYAVGWAMTMWRCGAIVIKLSYKL
jgi:WD40 repeat protein